MIISTNRYLLTDVQNVYARHQLHLSKFCLCARNREHGEQVRNPICQMYNSTDNCPARHLLFFLWVFKKISALVNSDHCVP